MTPLRVPRSEMPHGEPMRNKESFDRGEVSGLRHNEGRVCVQRTDEPWAARVERVEVFGEAGVGLEGPR